MRIRVTDDKELAAKIRKQLYENGGYCPCRIEKTPDTKCMCKDFINQKKGACHCGLYLKEEE